VRRGAAVGLERGGVGIDLRGPEHVQAGDVELGFFAKAVPAPLTSSPILKHYLLYLFVQSECAERDLGPGLDGASGIRTTR
jgi:hypothetical protein